MALTSKIAPYDSRWRALCFPLRKAVLKFSKDTEGQVLGLVYDDGDTRLPYSDRALILPIGHMGSGSPQQFICWQTLPVTTWQTLP